MEKVAILVDGGFYQKRASFLFGDKTPQERADELVQYCMRHIDKDGRDKAEDKRLYRIFYYDCKPCDKNIYHPLTQKMIDLSKTDVFTWSTAFQCSIISKRKVALRLGELIDSDTGYVIKPSVLKKLCRKELSIDDLKENDFSISLTQKGVDMRIGLDISLLATKKLVDQIVLIAGDSDFVPAAKFARREGIDFVLDPMWQSIKPSLQEHIDGLSSKVSKPDGTHTDHLSKYPDHILGKSFVKNKKKVYYPGQEIKIGRQHGKIINIETTTPKSYIIVVELDDKILLHYRNNIEEQFLLKKIQYFEVGTLVKHKQFGDGIVLDVKFLNTDFLYTVDFGNNGIKKLMASYANLKTTQSRNKKG